MTKVIAFTSGVSGAGVTTVAANIGASFALTGKFVVLVEMDERFSLHQQAGMKVGGASYAPSLFYAHTSVEELAGVVHEAQTSGADYVLMDVGMAPHYEWASLCDEVVVVTTMKEGVLLATDYLIGQLEEESEICPKLMVNHYDPESFTGFDRVVEHTLTDRIIGFILSSENDTKYEEPVALFPTQENGLRFRHSSRNLKEGTYRRFRTLHYPSSYRRTLKKITRFLHPETAKRDRRVAK